MRIDVLLAIAVGGALGALARYALSRIIHVAPGGFPWATFVINLTGAFVIGAFLTLVIERFPPSQYVRPFFAIGFLGAYTTFSTLAVETATLAKDHHAPLGIAYALVSVTSGLALAYVGIAAGRLLPLRARATHH
jgi:CrcB protein